MSDEDRLHDERARVVTIIDALGAEFDGIVATAALGATDDEHDPEGSTIAFERQRVAALLQDARVKLHALDEALASVATAEGATVPTSRLSCRTRPAQFAYTATRIWAGTPATTFLATLDRSRPRPFVTPTLRDNIPRGTSPCRRMRRAEQGFLMDESTQWTRHGGPQQGTAD